MMHKTFILVCLSIISLYVVLNVSFINSLSVNLYFHPPVQARTYAQRIKDAKGYHPKRRRQLDPSLLCRCGYLIACMIKMPSIEYIEDIFGQQNIVMPCKGLFTLATALCCTSNAIALKIAGCPVQVPSDGGFAMSCNLYRCR